MNERPAAVLLAPPRWRIRWGIFSLVFIYGLMAYIQQRSLSVASYQIMPTLHLSQVQIGWLESAFIIGYATFQFPGGVLGQRFGARLIYTGAGLLAVLAILMTSIAPALLSGVTLFAVLLAMQLLLGAAQGPLFPVSAGVIESWFVAHRWPLLLGVQSMGLGLGAALAPLIVASLMTALDWQRAFAWTTVPALLVIGLWGWSMRNTPGEHPWVTSTELAELGCQETNPLAYRISWRRMAALLKDRNVLLLTGSYLCMNYTFYLLSNWCFLYLVQERHFTVLEGGWLAAAPPLAAAFGAGIGGKLATDQVVRRGVRAGLRIVPLLSLPAAGVLLLLAEWAGNPYLAVAALAACFAFVELNEGPYWAAIMYVGRADTMSASGLLNTGGNIGGLIATPIVAYLSGQQAWTAAFLLGTGFSVAAGACWLLIDPSQKNERC